MGLDSAGTQSALDLGSALGGLFGGGPGSNQPAFSKVGAGTGLVAAGGGAAAGTAAASALAATSGIGALLIPVILLLSKTFKGADPFQVPASRIEQAFEVGSDNLYLVARSGMISKAEAAQGMQIFLQKGIEYYDQTIAREPRLQKAGEKGKRNMT